MWAFRSNPRDAHPLSSPVLQMHTGDQSRIAAICASHELDTVQLLNNVGRYSLSELDKITTHEVNTVGTSCLSWRSQYKSQNHWNCLKNRTNRTIACSLRDELGQ